MQQAEQGLPETVDPHSPAFSQASILSSPVNGNGDVLSPVAIRGLPPGRLLQPRTEPLASGTGGGASVGAGALAPASPPTSPLGHPSPGALLSSARALLERPPPTQDPALVELDTKIRDDCKYIRGRITASTEAIERRLDLALEEYHRRQPLNWTLPTLRPIPPRPDCWDAPFDKARALREIRQRRASEATPAPAPAPPAPQSPALSSPGPLVGGSEPSPGSGQTEPPRPPPLSDVQNGIGLRRQWADSNASSVSEGSIPAAVSASPDSIASSAPSEKKPPIVPSTTEAPTAQATAAPSPPSPAAPEPASAPKPPPPAKKEGEFNNGFVPVKFTMRAVSAAASSDWVSVGISASAGSPSEASTSGDNKSPKGKKSRKVAFADPDDGEAKKEKEKEREKEKEKEKAADPFSGFADSGDELESEGSSDCSSSGSEEETKAEEIVIEDWFGDDADLGPTLVINGQDGRNCVQAQLMASQGKRNLGVLDLTDNELTECPPAAFFFGPAVRRLILSDNLLTTCTKTFQNFKTLTELDLSGNETLFQEGGQGLEGIVQLAGTLSILHLCSMDLLELPMEVTKLTNLQELYLNENELDTFPPEIANLSDLTRLEGGMNEFEQLPSLLGSFSKLEAISFPDNKLQSLPPELFQGPPLQGIDFSDNEITSLPETVLECGETLVGLKLAGNPLSKFPKDLSTTLTYLSFVSLTMPPCPNTHMMASIEDWKTISNRSDQLDFSLKSVVSDE